MANQPYSREIAQTVLRYLDDDDWNYDFDEELGLIRFSLSLSSKIKHRKLQRIRSVSAWSRYGR